MPLKKRALLAEYVDRAPVVNSYLHNDSFPVGSSARRGPHRLLRLESGDADDSRKPTSSLALGCRLGPFGTLPQYDMEYWPKDAKSYPSRHRREDARPDAARRRSPCSADAKAFAHVLLDAKRCVTGWELESPTQ